MKYDIFFDDLGSGHKVEFVDVVKKPVGPPNDLVSKGGATKVFVHAKPGSKAEFVKATSESRIEETQITIEQLTNASYWMRGNRTRPVHVKGLIDPGLFKAILAGTSPPWGWGFVWYDLARNENIIAPMPLNAICRVAIRIYLRLMAGDPKWKLVKR